MPEKILNLKDRLLQKENNLLSRLKTSNNETIENKYGNTINVYDQNDITKTANNVGNKDNIINQYTGSKEALAIETRKSRFAMDTRNNSMLNVRQRELEPKGIVDSIKRAFVDQITKNGNRWIEGYDYEMVYRANGFDNANGPTEAMVRKSAELGFILGQIKGLNVDRNALRRLIEAVSTVKDGRVIESLLSRAIDNQIRNRTFLPYGNQSLEHTYHKYSLEQMMQMNLLKPENSNNPTQTFATLYNVGGRNNRLNKIGGVPLSDLKESGIHNFSDDATRYNEEKQDRGFAANIDVTQGNLQSAVANFKGSSLEQLNRSDYFADRQFFPFLFETINRSAVNGGVEGQFEQICFFQATISNIGESFVPNWSPRHYLGRTEEVYSYIKSSRTMDLSFVIFAASARELQNVYERVNWLAQQCYGSYGGDLGDRLNVSPLIRITIGDWFKRVPGFLQSLSLQWSGGNWEITKGLIMPQYCEVSITFQVIHESLPDRNYNFYGKMIKNIIQKNLIPGTSNQRKDKTLNEPYLDLVRRIGTEAANR